MDIYIEHAVKVKLEMSGVEFMALKDLVLNGRDSIEEHGTPNVEQAKVIGKIAYITDAQVRE